MDNLIQDLRFGLRMLAKNRWFTAVAVLTLALGIGINTAMFSFVDAVMLKPLGYNDAESLVVVWETTPHCTTCLPSPPTYLEWKTQNTVFSHVSAYTNSTTSLNLIGRENAEQIQGRFVSADYFDMLNILPQLGRTFREGEDQIGNEQVVILTNRIWRRKFGADPNIVGNSITLNEKPYTVVGVLPSEGIFDRMENEIWLPLTISPDRMRRNTQFFAARARIKPGITIEQADAEMKRLAASLEQNDPALKGRSVSLEPLRDVVVKTDLRNIMLLLMGAVLFVLLIASVNVANLLLARGSARRKEVAIRVSVGASRFRLMRQLLTESTLLAMLGGLGGILLAFWLIEAFIALMPPSTIPQEAAVALDYRVLAFTAGISILTGLLFGLIPAWSASKTNLVGLIKEQALTFSAGSGSRNLLLISEIALTFVLVIGAALMIRSFGRLLDVDPGFKADSILTFRSTLAQDRFQQPHQALAYQSEMLARIRALPGVKSAAMTNALPMTGSGTGTDFLIVGRPRDEAGRGNARIRATDPDYFRTLGIQLLKGRFLSEFDASSSQPVVLVNQTLADKFWSDRDPIGQQVLFAGPNPYTIAGVVADIKHNGLESKVPFEIYLSRLQIDEGWFNSFGRSSNFVVRADGDPMSLAGTIKDIAASIDKDQPLFEIKTMEQVVADSVAEPRFRTFLFGIFGGLALILAATGIYGVMAYSTAQRTQEIGIRMALGAQPRDIFKMVLRHGLVLALTGVAVGIGAAFAMTRLLSSLLFNVSATDPLTFSITPIILAGVAIAACYFPARRATKVDPMVALRYE